MYFKYLAEREPDKQVIQHEKGFAIYSFVTFGEEMAVYIEDIYVEKPHRKSHVASELSEQVQSHAIEKGCGVMLGTVAPSAVGSSVSMKVLLSHGMQLLKSEPDLIWFYKEL